ncbi:zinc metalloprotease [Spirillospora sp. NPDC047279]|uniref:zinc metalloprotease n=1 Tax=Spirillospora sp. NPDC047279 TaxID=3155478 RepID=UPI0033DBD85A
MKLLAVAVSALVSASVPAVPEISALPSAVRGAGTTAALPGGGGCARPDARIRPGADHARERNELSATEVVNVERELNGLLGALGVKSAPGETGRAKRRAPARVTIPVYFHVLHDGTRGNVPARTVQRQISVLNDGYGGRLGGADTRFTFSLRKITRTDNAAWYGDPEAYEETFKARLHRGGATTLNLYSADLGDELLGWSTFPWKYRNAPKMDGVVIHLGSMPGGSIERFNRGYSGTHEVGHWLGLYHPFQDGCASPGDRVSDTPPEREATNGCPESKDTCPAAGRDPVHNFMDYSWDSCMSEFTPGQGARMHKAWTAYRA